MDGNRFTSANLKDKVTVFNCWFTACVPCVTEIPDLNTLKEKYKKNFAYGPALAHHAEFTHMEKEAWVIYTDSGSIQEEASILWTPCVTARFGSDRTETILDWVNVLAPPINSNLIYDIVLWAIDNKDMKKKKHLYWENVSAKIVDEVEAMLKRDGKLFKFDDERLDLEQFFDWKI